MDSDILNRMAKHNTQVTLGITDERFELEWCQLSPSDETYQEYLMHSLEDCRKHLPNTPYTTAFEQFVKERI